MRDKTLCLRRSWLVPLALAWPLSVLAETSALAVGNQRVVNYNEGEGWYEDARAQASSAPGTGKVELFVAAGTEPTAGVPVSFRVARAEATTTYSDSITISATDLDGRSGRFGFGVRVMFGGLSVFTGGAGPGVFVQQGGALWSMRHTVGGVSFTAGCSWDTSPLFPDVASCSDIVIDGQPLQSIDARVHYEVPFTFGVPIPLDFYATALASMTVLATDIGTMASGSLQFSMGDSIYWDGITHVTVDGIPVDFSVSSASGADYSVSFAPPVPEPGTALLWAGGLGLLLAARRRRAGSGGAD